MRFILSAVLDPAFFVFIIFFISWLLFEMFSWRTDANWRFISHLVISKGFFNVVLMWENKINTIIATYYKNCTSSIGEDIIMSIQNSTRNITFNFRKH